MGPQRRVRHPAEASLVHQALDPLMPMDDHPPMLLLLHGRGSDELDLLALADALDPRLLLVSVRAPFSMSPGYNWYELMGPGHPEPRSFEHSLGLLNRFAGEIIQAYDVDPARLYLLGFSQGAMMAGSLTLSSPEGVAGAVLLSGYLPESLSRETSPEALRHKPFFVAHGTNDPVLPVELGRRARDFLKSVQADLTWCEYSIEHYVDSTELHDLSTWLSAQLDASANDRHA